MNTGSLTPQQIAQLDALGDNWMIRSDNNGTSYDSYQLAPIGEWNVCPKWGPQTGPDCYSGGFFGQGPGGFGFAKQGTRFTFCETRGPRMTVDQNKIKVPEMRILYAGLDAMLTLTYVCPLFDGSLDLRGCDLKGITLPDNVKILE